MSTNLYKDPREDMPVGAMSIYETEIDWVPHGKPYAHMVLEMHRDNQRSIDACERNGWFKPMCPWFDVNLDNILPTTTECLHKDNPFTGDPWSCYPSGCPTGWLSC